MAERTLRGLALGVVALGCLLRTIRLDADPDYYGWWGHVFDEGRWLEQARHVALHGTLPEHLGHNALIAPLFELSTTTVFWMGGVSLWMGRLVPAVSGCLLVVAVWLWMRGKVSPSAALLGVAMVAFPADLVVLSRVATPEMSALLGTTVAFMVLAGGPPSRGRMILAGLLCVGVLGIKLTTFFVVAIFVVVALTLRPPGSGVRARIEDAGWFGVGLAGPAIVAAPIAFVVAEKAGFDVWARLGVFSHFFGLRDPYSLAALPYLTIDAPVIVSSGLALWLAWIAWLGAADRRDADLRWMRAAATWAALYILVFTFQLYFPGRYRAHVLVPLALVAAHAVSRLEEQGLGAVVERIRGSEGLRRAVLVAFLVFVASLHLSALGNPGAAIAGLDPERLSTRFVVTVVGWGALAAALWRALDRAAVVRGLVAFSVVATILQFAHWIVAPYTAEFFLVTPSQLPGRLVMLTLEGLLTAALLRGVRRPALVLVPATGTAALLMAAWGAHLWTGIVEPRYTLREATAEVGRLLEGETGIRQNRAESLFIGNRLSHTVLKVPLYEQDPPEVVVVELPLMRDTGFLHRHYDVVKSFELYVPPGHHLPPRRSEICPGSGQCFAILRLREQSLAR